MPGSVSRCSGKSVSASTLISPLIPCVVRTLPTSSSCSAKVETGALELTVAESIRVLCALPKKSRRQLAVQCCSGQLDRVLSGLCVERLGRTKADWLL